MENPNGAVQGNSQNNPTANLPRTRSTFNLGYHFFDTHRFGEYHPHFVSDGVKEDSLPIRSSHEVLSYTLKSPLMQRITMNKDYFSVPCEAILPENWDKFFVNPVRGDDVLNDVGTTIEEFWSFIGNVFSNILTAIQGIVTDGTLLPSQILQAYFRFLILGEYIYSNGNLLSSLGCHGAPYLEVREPLGQGAYRFSTFDKFFDESIREIVRICSSQNQYLFNLIVDGDTYVVNDQLDAGFYDNTSIDIRHALALMRDNPTFTISIVPVSTGLASALDQLLTDWDMYPVLVKSPLKLERLWAYQLVCAHYYSNDHIDFVFSANLYRQLIGSYVIRQNFNTSQLHFTYNGIRYRYDWCSAHYARLIMAGNSSAWRTTLLDTSTLPEQSKLGYFSALFGYRRSLRYQDYFTGSRSQPLAVGSTGVSVVNNTVDVVDVTRNIQRQRFLNAVNRVRHNFEGYLQGIFGGNVPAPDYHNPFFLAHTDDIVYGQETENTGADQLTAPVSITSNLHSNGSRYMFEINCDRPCFIIGITWYDLPRVYSKSIERPFFHVDRFDMFNPFMQFIGDQPIYIQELGLNPHNSITALQNFAYTLRHMEYKQRFNQAAGGFVENLPGYAFIAKDSRGDQSVINPDWIRSVPSEIDQFFVKLTGYSLGSYWHFIVDNYNDCTGSRPMAFAPSIL